MLEALTNVTSPLLGPFYSVLALMGAVWFAWEMRIHNNLADDSFKKRYKALAHDSWGERYRAFLHGVLRFFSSIFGELDEQRAPRQRWVSRLFPLQPFTPLAYERCLFLALVYPLLFALIGWVAGGDGLIGELKLFNAQAPDWARIGVLLGVVIGAGLIILGGRTQAKARVLLVIGGLAFILVTVIYSNEKGYVEGAVAVAVAVAVVVAGAVAFAGAAADAVVFAGTVAGVFAGADAAIFAVAVAVALVAEKLYKRSQPLSLYWLVFTVFFLVYLAMMLWLASAYGAVEELPNAFSLLLFLGFLPLANAGLDWLSLGFTRGLLHKLANVHHNALTGFAWALLDAALAIVFLFLVLLSTITVIAIANTVSESQGAPAVLNLVQLWADLKAGGTTNNLWFYLLVFSTLIPTAIHFLTAAFALVLVPATATRARWATVMQDKHAEYARAQQAGEQASTALNDSDIRLYAVCCRVLNPILPVGLALALIYLVSTGLIAIMPATVDVILHVVGQWMALAIT
ncbi:MAG: hypothetical protein AAF434_12640 [Pseudomonadota bacterium]